MSSEAQLPACQKCKIRKVRCDRQAPKCNNCTKGNVACIIIDPVTGEQYARDYIRQLEEEEAALREKLGERPVATESALTTFSDEAERTPRGPPTGGSTGSHSGFVGDGSGLGFLHRILSDAKWQHHRVQVTNQLASRPRIMHLHLIPNPLPPLQEAERLLDSYFTRFHIHHTFLLRQEVLNMFTRIYSPSTESTRPSSQDHFRLLMVFAISAIPRHRAGISAEHPYGYFMAAEAHLGSIPLIKDTDAIQNLLLIARFGMYHHIGTSLWEISQLCIRQCIEWQLHTRSIHPLDPLTEQHRRRIFWECYVLDRYSSGILGRPFSILEADISVPLPIDADDETLVPSTAASLDLIPPNTSSRPTELSIFIFCIKLRQISSRIHSAFYTSNSLTSQGSGSGTRASTSRFKSIGHVYTSFSQFHQELRAWRSTAPIFPNPRSLYERPEWHDFLYEKDLVLLARGAMHNVPSRPYSTGGVTKEILMTCYVSASRIIELYADLMDKRSITWTRSYFQVIFTAGLTVIYCVSLDVLKDNMNSRDPTQTLALCSDILCFFKDRMPDAGSFAVVFELLKDEFIKHRFQGSQNFPSNTETTARRSARERIQHSDIAILQGDMRLGTGDETLPSGILQATETEASQISASTNADAMQFNAHHGLQNQDFGTYDFSLGLTDELMSQLEAGLGEYAWGWIPTDDNYWNQISFD